MLGWGPVGPALDWAGHDPAYKIATWGHSERWETVSATLALRASQRTKKTLGKFLVPVLPHSVAFLRSLHVHQGKRAGDLVDGWDKGSPSDGECFSACFPRGACAAKNVAHKLFFTTDTKSVTDHNTNSS